MAQQKQQLEMAVLQAQMQDLKSRANANEGLGLERVSRVQENRALAVQRIAEAHRDEETGVLNTIKAIKELQGMDLSNLQALLNIAQAIQQESIGKNSEAEQQAQAMSQPSQMASAGQSPSI
jgi:hypothetical protein